MIHVASSNNTVVFKMSDDTGTSSNSAATTPSVRSTTSTNSTNSTNSMNSKSRPIRYSLVTSLLVFSQSIIVCISSVQGFIVIPTQTSTPTSLMRSTDASCTSCNINSDISYLNRNNLHRSTCSTCTTCSRPLTSLSFAPSDFNSDYVYTASRSSRSSSRSSSKSSSKSSSRSKSKRRNAIIYKSTSLFFTQSNNNQSNNNNNNNQSKHKAHATPPPTNTNTSSPLPLPDSSDPFVILSVSKNASKSEIKRSYRDLALKYHPDAWINSSSTEEDRQRANDDFARINAAYGFIMENFDQMELYGGMGMGTMSTMTKEQRERDPASADAVANGWSHNKPKSNPNQQPQPQYPGGGGDGTSQQQHPPNQAYKHYGANDFHSKYASGSAANFNAQDRERAVKRQQDLKQHYENLSSNRHKYKKYGGTSSNMGFYESYNETETKGNDTYHIHVDKQKRGNTGATNGVSGFSGGVNPGVSGVQVDLNSVVDQGNNNYGGNRDYAPGGANGFGQAAGAGAGGYANYQRQRQQPQPQPIPPQPQRPVYRQQPMNVQSQSVNGHVSRHPQPVNNRQQQEAHRQQPMRGYQNVNGQVNAPPQPMNRNQQQQQQPMNVQEQQQWQQQQQQPVRPGSYGNVGNVGNVQFNNDGVHDYRTRKNAKYRRQKIDHSNGPIHNVPKQVYQQQQQQYVQSQAPIPPPYQEQQPQQPQQPYQYQQQQQQQQQPPPAQRQPYQAANSKYAQRPKYAAGTRVYYTDDYRKQPQKSVNTGGTRVYYTEDYRSQSQRSINNVQQGYRPQANNNVGQQQPQAQQQQYYQPQPPQTPPTLEQRMYNNQASFEYKREVYGGTSSDAQKKDKKKRQTFSRYSGTDLDNDFARRVRSTAPAAPQSKYTRSGYGGTSTDAVSQTAQGNGIGASPAAKKKGTSVAASKKYGGTSADAMKNKKAPVAKTVASSSAGVNFTRRKYNNPGPTIASTPQNNAVNAKVNINHEPVQPQKARKNVVGPPFNRQGFGGTSSPYVKSKSNVADPKPEAKTQASTAGYKQKQKPISDERRYGDFFDAASFHDKWNTSNPDPADKANRPAAGRRGYAVKSSAEEEQRRYNEAVLIEARRRAEQLTSKLKEEEKKKKSHIGSFESGLSLAVKAVTSLFVSSAKRETETTETTPGRNFQFSPYEACTMIEMHQRDPTKDQDKAIEIMLRNRNVPVDKTELLSLYGKYREGRVATNHRWEKI